MAISQTLPDPDCGPRSLRDSYWRTSDAPPWTRSFLADARRRNCVFTGTSAGPWATRAHAGHLRRHPAGNRRQRTYAPGIRGRRGLARIGELHGGAPRLAADAAGAGVR